jgi:hypothetical protein
MRGRNILVGLRHPGALVDHAGQPGPRGGGSADGRPQRLDDTEQLAILALLEAASTERSAMRAARALAELMRHLNALGQRIAAELPSHDRNGQAPRHEPT